MSATPVALRLSEEPGTQSGVPLVLGHSLGTSAELWSEALPWLRDRFRVFLWELPGHGGGKPATGPYRVEDVTDGLVAGLRARGVDSFHYAGVSISGCVGLDLCLRYPESVTTATVISTGARVDDPPLMRERAVVARADGLDGFVEAFRTRWFATATPAATADRILSMLARTDAESYAFAAEALADFDVWNLVPRIETPLLAVGAEEDRSVPVERSFELARRARRGSAISIPRSAHSVVAERPDAVSSVIVEFAEQHRRRQ
ncbi:alpha/beta fold hydrolase [Microbacterium sp. NPDC064584]|uniref:alpha/beta fold hydrolase n=1 Tax=Microbacterium sp. NPDC064584 TaxID=3155817 RepID=UPI00342E2A74